MKKFLSAAGLIPIKSGLLLILNSQFLILNSFSQSPNWLWAKEMGGITSSDGIRCNSIAAELAGSGDVYTTGRFFGTVDFDPGVGVFNLTAAGVFQIFISKLDSSGNFVWVKAMGGTANYYAGSSISIDPAGSEDIYITGSFQGTADFDPGIGVFNLTSVGDDDIFISKLDSSGNFVWAKSMGGMDLDKSSSIAIDPAGSGALYTTGSFLGTVDFDPGSGVFNLTAALIGYPTIFISKLDNSGNFVWAKQLGGGGSDEGTSIAIDLRGSGDVYTTGSFNGTGDFDPGVGVFNLIPAGSWDIFISKLDSSGNFVWAKSMGGTNSDLANSLAIDPSGSGDVYTTGSFYDTADFDPGAGVHNLTPVALEDIFISKLDSQGNFVWAKAIGGYGDDIGNSIATDPSGSGALYTTGRFKTTVDFDPGAGVFNLTSAGLWDIFISKLDSSGNFVWAKAAGGTNWDYGNSISVGASGHVYMTGEFDSPSITFGSTTLLTATPGNPDIFIAKLNTTTVTTGNNEIENSGNVFSVFPNPLTNTTTISFSLTQSENVSLRIYELNGRLVTALADKIFEEGENKLEWNASGMDRGIYFLQFQTAEIIKTEKLFITK